MNPLGMVAGILLSASPDGWSVCASGRLVAIDAERVLYTTPNSGEFWVHFRVRNLTRQPIGISLNTGWQLFYPNQWQGSPTATRQAIDERRMNVSPLDAGEKKVLVDAWLAQKLVLIPADGNADYFRVFNGSGHSRAEFDKQAGPFMIVAMDGQLRATDGTQTELILPMETGRELSLPSPVKWATIPPDGRHVDVR